MELRGFIHEIGPVQQLTERFSKRDVILSQFVGQNMEYIKLDAINDKIHLFEQINVGDEVEVSFIVRGRAWTDKEGVTKYFNSLIINSVTKINRERVSVNQPVAPQFSQPAPQPAPQQVAQPAPQPVVPQQPVQAAPVQNPVNAPTQVVQQTTQYQTAQPVSYNNGGQDDLPF